MRNLKSSSSSVAELADVMRGALPPDFGLGATLEFDFGPAGVLFVDGKSTPNAIVDVGAVPDAADCTIHISTGDFALMMRGQLDGMSALREKRLRIAGDMNVAMRFGPVMQQASV